MIEIIKIWTDSEAIWIETSDGKIAYEKFTDYTRLREATLAERDNYEHDAFGIHWPDLDEDLSFDGFFSDKNKETPILYQIFTRHPEINVSAIARRLGMKQSLLAAYISGAKKPSQLRLAEIISCLNEVGRELSQIELPESKKSIVADH